MQHHGSSCLHTCQDHDKGGDGLQAEVLLRLALGMSWGDLCPLGLRPTTISSFSRARTMTSKKLFSSPSLHACL